MRGLLEVRSRFERRVIVFQLLSVGLLALLAFRLLDLQWLQHEGLLLQAEQNRINVVPILPTRGEITDRNDKGLAVNHVSYRLQIIPERVSNMDKTLAMLSEMLQWNNRQLAQIRRRIRQARADRPVLVDDKLAWHLVAPIAARLHHFAGVDVQAGTHRYYPHAQLTSHLIGYLSLANREDVRSGALPIEKVGRAGIEKIYEARLHGKTGNQQEEVDARGRRVGVLLRTPPARGGRLRLSLDVDLQRAAAKALGARTGAVVILDVHTGEVLTLLSQPGFNTNRFISGLEWNQWQAWLKDERRPLLNRATQAAYPPASTFKLLTALAGLRHQIATPRQKITCPGYLEFADRKLRCWKPDGHGRVNLYEALVQSCDVYFYVLGDRLGIERLQREAALWGFGQPTGVPLTPESRTMVPGQSWKDRQVSRKWFRGETMIAAIGQGDVTVTPLQLARFAAAVANGGVLFKPRLEANQPPVVAKEIQVETKHLHAIRKAMRGVTSDPKGTAFASLAKLPWKIAGKTGTAQVIAMSQSKKKSSRPKKRQHEDHAWFIGYAPADNPRIAFAIFVEHGGHGGSAAAPIAAAIIRAWAVREQS